MLPIRTNSDRKGIILSVKNFGRRSRPRAKSVDSQYQSGVDNSSFEITRSSESISQQTTIKKYGEYDHESDQLTPLLIKKETKNPTYNRSYSLDSDPQYQYILYGTSCSFLTSGLSITLKPYKQNSLVTIFAIWNTIIGSSLLAMPWSVQRAGLVLALMLMFFVSTLAVYTAYRLLTVQIIHGDCDVGEVPFLCKKLLGKWAELISRIFSFVIIFGANIVYWILMSNCLYHSVEYLTDILGSTDANMQANDENNTVLCPSKNVENASISNMEKTLFQSVWNLEITVPIFLIVIVAPLLNFKSATFFTKFNSIGDTLVGKIVDKVQSNGGWRNTKEEMHFSLYFMNKKITKDTVIYNF